VLVGGIDIDATLTIWAIRDQIVSVEQAKAISALYFKYIDKVAAEKDKGTADFGVWHRTSCSSTGAISASAWHLAATHFMWAAQWCCRG